MRAMDLLLFLLLTTFRNKTEILIIKKVTDMIIKKLIKKLETLHTSDPEAKVGCCSCTVGTLPLFFQTHIAAKKLQGCCKERIGKEYFFYISYLYIFY